MPANQGKLEALTRDSLEGLQLKRLNTLLQQVQKRPFYKNWFNDDVMQLGHLEELLSLPLLEKSDLLSTESCAPGLQFDLPRKTYTRLHQTSGTKGFPMAVLDTPEDWEWWLKCWDHVLDAAEITESDVAMMAFSFGPFIGFWTANDALVKRGALVVPGGGLSSQKRLQMIADHRCTILCCTPTYALHLVSVANQMGLNLSESTITRIIVAGEPGGSIPSVRSRIEQGWGAKVIDHCGASEVGAWGFGDSKGEGIHVIETEFIAEVLQVDDSSPRGRPVPEGHLGELVLTSLGRFGGPVIRYRTGDRVRAFRDHQKSCPFIWFDGGVVGRADDMLVIRGVNVFPSSVESIVRDCLAYAEFRMIATKKDEMDQLEIEVEADKEGVDKLALALRDRLTLRVDVRPVPIGSLPRFEAKSRRLDDQR